MKKSFKRFAAILLGLALLATSATVAFAAGDDKTVTFTGDKLAANYTDTSVAQQLFTMQPGDTTTIDIELENKVGSSATWYLNNAVLKSLEQNSPNGASGGAYTYELIYNPGQADQVILFQSERVGGSDNTPSRSARAVTSDAGLGEINENLSGYQFLATLPAGGRARVRLTVALDGETQGNSYQDTLADLQMNFAVELRDDLPDRPDEPDKPPTPVDDTQPTPEPGRRTDIVRTSDESQLPLLAAISGVTGLMLLAYCIYCFREHKKGKKGE